VIFHNYFGVFGRFGFIGFTIILGWFTICKIIMVVVNGVVLLGFG
jgi:hypothetical protein